jgi:hypothetical protein
MDFFILPLPAEPLSFVTQALQAAESSCTHAKSCPMKTKTESGAAGLVSATNLTLSSLLYRSRMIDLLNAMLIVLAKSMW